MKALFEEDLTSLLSHAVSSEKGFGNMDVDIAEEDLAVIARFANGDARTALNTLEMAVLNGEIDEKGVVHVTEQVLSECMTVSYTHLDVYKRQIFHREEKGKVGADKKARQNISQNQRLLDFFKKNRNQSCRQQHNGQILYHIRYVHVPGLLRNEPHVNFYSIIIYEKRYRLKSFFEKMYLHENLICIVRKLQVIRCV